MLTPTEGTTKGRNLFGNILGLPIRYHNCFPVIVILSGGGIPKDTVASIKVGPWDQSGFRDGFVSSPRLLDKKRPPGPAHGRR